MSAESYRFFCINFFLFCDPLRHILSRYTALIFTSLLPNGSYLFVFIDADLFFLIP